MAVMYSKLGGCLGVTAKLGPLARTDLWVGVKGLLDRLITHLGLGSSFEEPWLALLGGVEVGLPSREVAQASWEGCVGCGLWGCLLPCLPALGRLLPCPAWGDLEDWGELDIGGGVVWEELFSSLAGVKTVCWEELSSSEGRCTAPGRELLPSPGGRWAIGRVLLGDWVWLLAELPMLLVMLLLLAWLLAELPMILVVLLLLAWLLGRLLPSNERWTVARRGLLPSPRGRRALARVGLRELQEACLFIGLVMVFTALASATFPSFLDTNWFNLFICLCFTLVNLSSLTLLMKSWHSPSLSAEMIEASLDLHSWICLSTWSKILLMALTLACSKSFFHFSNDLSSLGSV